MSEIGALGYALSGLAFAVLALFIVIRWRSQNSAIFFLLASIVTSIWSFAMAYALYAVNEVTLLVTMLGLARNLTWAVLLTRLIESFNGGSMPASRILAASARGSYVLPIFLGAFILYISTGENHPVEWIEFDLRVLLYIVMAIVGLLLVEFLFVFGGQERRWAVKFVCFGFAILYAFDFYMYSDALFFGVIDSANWAARGFVTIFAAPLIALGISRLSPARIGLNVSRQLVFYAITSLLAGGYLLVVAAGGYYFRYYGGDWGRVAVNTFVFAALVFLLALLTSGSLRSRLRVFIDKHFLSYKYDYREEWLRLIRLLSTETDAKRLQTRSVTALCDIVDSPAGMLWIRKNDEIFFPVESQNMFAISDTEPISGSLAKFLENWQWVINLDEYRNDNTMYEGLVAPSWLDRLQDAWLIVPLMLQVRLYGFVVVARPRVEREFNWEDIDLLKTAGRQVAIHLAQARSAEALAQARQFEAFNRLSSYIMHDLKNLMSQLSLVVKNAEKHRSNPAFIDDAIKTVDNSVLRMNRLLAQLKAGVVSPNQTRQIDVSQAITQVIADKKNVRPVPSVDIKHANIFVCADYHRFVSILGHVVQNAQDATPADGEIHIEAWSHEGFAMIKVVDNGCGMDEDFVRERLFRPFDSTKGLAGMGIGAHDVKQFVEGLGGRVEVTSKLHSGTSFVLCIPLCN